MISSSVGRRVGTGLAAVLASVVLTLEFYAAPVQTVVLEHQMRAELTPDGLNITLPIRLASGGSFTLAIELLTSDGSITASGAANVRLKSGDNRATVAVRWPALVSEDRWEARRDLLMWTRVRYRLSRHSKESPGDSETGIRALGPSVEGFFAIRAIIPEDPPMGTPTHFRVFAENPFTGAPVPGVHVDASLTSEEHKDEPWSITRVRFNTETGPDGSVAGDFSLPAEWEKQAESSPEFVLRLAGTLGFLHSEAEHEVTFYRIRSAIVTTDKSLYQPGQHLNVRALIYNKESRRPSPAQTVTMSIDDEADKTVFEREIQSDRFGIVATEWPIPVTAPLGEYTIRVEDAGDRLSSARVRVSRYELPTFVTVAEPDRQFYLPGSDAKVRVSARFVYGEAVKAGRVRIAREESREWNFAQQRWEVREEGVWEGDCDADGVYVANVPLSQEHEALSKSKDEAYHDAEYVARFTESASGRSEERRFRIRVSKEPIHIYVFSIEGRQSFKLPLRFCVVANYADGRPAIASISIEGRRLLSSDATEPGPPVLTLQARTDQHGVAMVEGTPRIDSEAHLAISVLARDEMGATGSRRDDLYVDEKDGLRLRTPRVLYHSGEPLVVDVESTVMTIPRLTLEVRAESRVIRSQIVSLRNGRATVGFQPGDDLKGRISVLAYDPDEDRSDEWLWAGNRLALRAVLYPSHQALDLSAQFERSTVKPGELARAVFKAQEAGGAGREASLGVAVFDSAVEERARTEIETDKGENRFDEYYATFLNWYQSVSDVTLRELEELDQSKPFPAELELAADALLQRIGKWSSYRAYSIRVNGEAARAAHSDVLDPIAETLNYILSKTPTVRYPRDASSLYSLMSTHGVPMNQMTDAWGNQYRTEFDVKGRDLHVEIWSDGPDEQPHTRDDFLLAEHSKPFFDPAGSTEIEAALDSFKKHRGRYPNEANELVAELRERNSKFNQMVDAWGTPYGLAYSHSVFLPKFEVAVVSAGPDRRRGWNNRGDDVEVLSLERDWFADERKRIEQILNRHLAATHNYPSNEAELRKVLEANGVKADALRDPWDQPLRFAFGQSSQYGERRVISRVAASGFLPSFDRVTLEPVTRTLGWIRLEMSARQLLTAPGKSSDIPVAYFSQVIKEESRRDAAIAAGSAGPVDSSAPGSKRRRAVATGLSGCISGIVTDPQGAVIANATVTVTNNETGFSQMGRTDEEGVYVFSALAPGSYSVRAEALGFNPIIFSLVMVRLSTTTALDISLNVGTASEVVTVSAGAAELLQTSASRSLLQVSNLPIQGRNSGPASTPRLRQDFPETLVWQPSLITDAHGNAQLEFKVADSITTWRLAAIGSTEDGLIGTATADLRSVQPFFVEYQPPSNLTVGDEIQSPVVVRNYSERAADVRVGLAPAPWMKVVGAANNLRVESQSSATENVTFTATAAGGFKQEASAIGEDQGDRLARPVSVRFDGRDTWRTYGDLFQGEGAFDVDLPLNGIAGSNRIDLTLYPDLYGHALDAVQGIVQRPHGCIEQTTSAGYANLIALQCLKRAGRSSPVEAQALRNLADAVARIRSFGSGEMGYSYFAGGSTDIALTSYVLRFLSEAREFIQIDNDTLNGIRRYLAHAQRADGAWEAEPRRTEAATPEETLRITAMVVRALSESARAVPIVVQGAAKGQPADDPAASLIKGLDWLVESALSSDDSYALASYAIAATHFGRADSAREAAVHLSHRAQAEAGALFWDQQSNTPFCGWGRAGRMETTGLAVEALKLVGEGEQRAGRTTSELQRAARLGLLFLLKNKDEYNVWYSTQATVNALRAIVAFALGDANTHGRKVDLLIAADGGAPQTVPLNSDGTPTSIDLLRLFPQLAVARGKHRISVKTGIAGTVSASLVARSTVPWTAGDAAGVSQDGGLLLRVGFDRTELAQRETIRCSVHAERVGARGYGMMLAEIGLPPGVDVDVASLRDAPVESFDVTPDRVVFYLWPQAGGTDFSFTFRPRLRIKAAAQPSLLYDYYNPDSRVSTAPERFIVK